ncbi:MAG: AAA family ATPase [Candidatus Bathyarchaeota archaeon]|nr:AAA family ATPase [Candidatus Bathyarchaeota archaeon]
MARWIPTGCSSLDRALEGGLPAGGLDLLYGEAETGKTTLAMQCAVNCARMGYKVLYVDSERTFLPERLSQIAFQDFEEVSGFIMVARPSSFGEQIEVVDNLERYLTRRFGLVVFDTVTSLYRSELIDKKETFNLNRELNRQVATLAQIAKTLEVSVLLVSQVRSVVDEADVVPVATRVLKFWCDAVLGLSRMGRRNMVRASVEKSGGRETRMSFYLVIEEDGIHDHNP